MTASVAFSLLAFTAAPDLADAADLASYALVVATLLLAMIAAWVAVLAYAAATGTPDLQVMLYFRLSAPNAPHFEAGRDDSGNLQAIGSSQVVGEIYLRNNSPYSARNPVVIVRLRGMIFRSIPMDG
jgi:hypothetical protein